MRTKMLLTAGLTLVVAIALSCGESIAQSKDAKKTPPKSPNRTVITGDGSMSLKLKKGLDLTGTPLDLESVKMTSIIGEIDIPLHTVAGIKFPEKAGESHTVVLHNGDSLTGDVQLSAVKIVSPWGEASVNASELNYLVFGNNLRWTNDTSSGNGRWRLSRVSATPPVSTTKTTRQTQPARPRAAVDSNGRLIRSGF